MVTMTTDTTHPLPEGTLVRLTETSDAYPVGTQFVLDEYVEPREENQREDEDEIDEPIYYGNINGGSGNIWAPARVVEVVKTAAEMDARRKPTKNQIASQIARSLMDEFQTFETDETFCPENAEWVEVYGKTFDGLTFGFRVVVTTIWDTDL